MSLLRIRISLLCACAMVLASLPGPGPAWADEPALAIRSHCERVEISGRLATTTVEQVYVNYIGREQEASLRFCLPPDAAVHDLALWVKGMRCPGEIHPRVSAEEIYRTIVSKQRDPALLTRVGPGQWNLRVFPVPANGTAKVEFRFTQLLPLVEGQLTYTGLAAESWLGVKAQDFDFVATIRAPGGVAAMKCATHDLGLQRGAGGEWTVAVRKEQADLTRPVSLAYKPVAAAPEAACWSGKEGGVFAAVLPPSARLSRKRPRQIVFVLDASQSMRGERMNLARLALMGMVQKLEQQDRFALVVVGSDAALWKNELLPASDQNKGQAVDYVSGLHGGGGTDLQAGLKAAATFLKGLRGMLDIVLISDLDDRVGTVPAEQGATTRPAGDANAAWPAAPPPKCRLSAVAIDPGVANSGSIFGVPDERRTDHVVAATGGVGLNIYKAADVAGAVDKVILLSATPVIADVRYDVKADEAVGLSEVGCSELTGERAVVVVGRYRAAGTVRVTLRAKVDGKAAAELADLTLPDPKAQAGWANAGLTRVWAYLRAVRMWQEMRSRQPDMKGLKAVVDLSRAHRVVTPATAMLVLESDVDYLRRGIPRKVSMVPVGQTPGEAARALALVAAGPQLPAEMAQELAVMNQQARELERLGSYELAAQVFARIADQFRGQFEARRREAMIHELLALRELARVVQARRAEEEAYWQQVPWYAAASQAGP
ncbi:MAG TPA: VIT and VWA domain-containing protein, partial [Phycisphaerae bacterium]|nr:VIT and VWA domain-containing protein [Phycisphaerae bacterium]